MWLNCLLVVFLSSIHLVYSLNFEDADTDIDPEEEWDSLESFTLSPDDDDDTENSGDGDGFMTQFKASLPDSNPVQVKAGLDSKPFKVKPDLSDSKPVQEKGGLSGSKPFKVKPDISDSKPVQVKNGLSHSKPFRPLLLPGSVRIQASMLHKELFTPERHSRPVPPLLKSILLAETADVKPKKPVSDPNMEVMCYMDRIHVKVRRSLFSDPSAWKKLKLGTCAVNKVSDTHYQFLYYLKGCGIQRGEDADRVTYSNTLQYMPDATELIVREQSFRVPIRCSYTKFHRSYKVGFLPHVAGGVLYKSIETRTGPTLAAMDASWNLLPVGQSFDLGKPVCFEAKSPSRGARKRLYLNRCFVTSKPSPWSKDKYSVVENYGCLVDSKNSVWTKFYTSDDKMTVRLCVGAFLFKHMVSQPQSSKTMYLHCELDFGPETPTPSAKSCMYNRHTKKWTELYGDASVCNCCASTCPASPRISGKSMITSESWELKMGKETSSPEEAMPEFPLTGDDFEFSWESEDY
ncbi:zona pellucida sperm-binding protein 3 [Rhinichthys klamathensis goyatoka]|uniref:zona pellucida sperm-binding protein 3 n=1 Tax=Rhinichthys klamathensis goyatoka TaxID=3034132 RepID=UPI0024B49AE4|nr:zona pellucida sperm-binding protein 3 [Rhinichthys klamathensis goyatoka]